MNGIRRFWNLLLWHDWPHRAAVLLAGLFLLQFVLWFEKEEGLWLPETVRIVQLTLLITLVIEHIPKLHWLLRGVFELIGIIAINVTVLVQYDVIAPMTLGSFFSSKLFLNLYQLTPYLWFALGAWVVYLAVVWWVELKWRIYAMLLLSIIAMCIRDSFSSIYLWPQVAVIVACGLFMLILSHFQQLRRKDAGAWKHLAEYPASIAVPVVSLISLTVAVGALMPEIGPLLTDPYSAWRAYRGEPLAFTTGKGVAVATLSPGDSSSGYSRDDSALGGGFDFDYSPVMTVDTTHRSYWRGEAKSLYTGKGWDKSDNERRSPLSGVRPDALLPPDPRQPAGRLKTVEVKQIVTMLSEERFPILFGSYAIQKLEDVNDAKTDFGGIVWSSRQAELRYVDRDPYPKRYTIVSQMPVIDEDLLRQTGFVPNRGEFAEYLQLPDQLPERVRELAAEITEDAANPYDKAKSIEKYLQTTFTYNNRPDLSKGKSHDLVDRFLFEMKEGYCDYFSSAMAVMARSVGLPTRWVKGYAPGSTIMEEEMFGWTQDMGLIDPNAPGLYTVRNSDAHSWVEVYFSGYGWIPFEPTAGFAIPQPVLEEETVPELAPAPTPEVEAAQEEEPIVQTRHIAWGTVLVSAAAILAFLAWRFQLLELLSEKVRRRRASLLKQKVIIECERLLRICRRSGYVREEHETLREAVMRWTRQSKWLKDDLESVLSIFEKAKYGKTDITEDDLRRTVSIVEKLRSQL
ncbi:transglutaminase TgpA family protein [Paenibacillus ginsengihumi]|uniref:transglutaminase TgpA family protein n=1 Tax=Paenibacillus ginsengihumi TaxID=431596 RepID=UPI00036E88EB|nr:transglutaminaseTgpA domain-containing protein [Paenibacillus ginsengihumi]